MRNKDEQLVDSYPSEYRLIFDHVPVTANNTRLETDEINNLRKATENINQPIYTYSTSTEISPTYRIK